MLDEALMSFSILFFNEKILALLILQGCCEEQINATG